MLGYFRDEKYAEAVPCTEPRVDMSWIVKVLPGDEPVECPGGRLLLLRPWELGQLHSGYCYFDSIRKFTLYIFIGKTVIGLR